MVDRDQGRHIYRLIERDKGRLIDKQRQPKTKGQKLKYSHLHS